MYQFDTLQTQELSRIVHEKRHRLLGQDNYQRFGLDFPLAVRSLTVRRHRFLRVSVAAKAWRHVARDVGPCRSLWYALDDVPAQHISQGDVFFSIDDDHASSLFADADRVAYTPQQDEGVSLVGSPLFTTALYDLDDPVTIDYSELDSFVLLTAVQGSGEVADDSGQRLTLCEGHSLLIPATTKNIKIEGTIRLLETYV